MPIKKLSWNRGLIAGALIAAALGFTLHFLKIGYKFRSLSYDLLLIKRPHLHPQEAVIVYLDEISHEQMNQPLNAPWDRALHAKLLNRLTDAGARAVVFDIVFTDPNPNNPEADQQFADAIKRNGRVVLAADHIPIGDGQKQFLKPFDLLLDSANGRMGSAEMKPDNDLVVRLMPPNDEIVPSLSWVAAELNGAPVTKKPDTADVQRWMNYYRPANTTPARRYFEALDPSVVPDSFFSNKVVLVGARIITKFAGDRKDEYVTPHTLLEDRSENLFISGVEIQATALLNLLRGDWLTRWPFAVEGLIVIGFGLLAGYSLAHLRPGPATALAAALLILAAFLAYQTFLRTRIWLPWLLFEIQVIAAWLWSILYNSILLYVENRLFVQSLEMYLSPKLVKKFAADKDRKLLKPGAQKQKLTVLFSDIEGFTSKTEGMDSDELAQMMNEYFQGAVGKCIHASDGTVVKYIGDAIFAFWNAPDPQDDHAIRACEAALLFRVQSKVLVHGRLLPTRIGLHTGVANVGNFGSETRVDYTALGENINLAARMEGLNKYLGTDVLITGDTKREMSDRFVARYLGKFQLKGFEKSVEVHELLGTPAEAEKLQSLHLAFEEALRLFQQRDIAAAENAFQRAAESFPNDGPIKFYLKHLHEIRGQVLEPDWAGEVELKEK